MLRVDAASVSATISGLKGVTEAVASAVSIAAAGEVLRDRCRASIALTDHTLEALRRLGHPYARRHGRIRIHTSKPWLVHTQSGQMLAALRSANYLRNGIPTAAVWINETAAPHARYIVDGTNTMLPRDVLWMTVTAMDVRRDIMRAFVRALGKDLRSKAMIRFEQRTGFEVRGSIAGTGPGGALGV